MLCTGEKAAKYLLFTAGWGQRLLCPVLFMTLISPVKIMTLRGGWLRCADRVCAAVYNKMEKIKKIALHSHESMVQ
jgi:hypothetical protein